MSFSLPFTIAPSVSVRTDLTTPSPTGHAKANASTTDAMAASPECETRGITETSGPLEVEIEFDLSSGSSIIEPTSTQLSCDDFYTFKSSITTRCLACERA